MPLEKNKSLKNYNTFGIDVSASNFVSVSSVSELKETLLTYKNTPIFILGGGSNMLLTKPIDALVLHINLKGISVVSENETTATITAQAGENWHNFVLWALEKNYAGIENLAFIPGTVGAAPIQNIGAYGVELKTVFKSCRALEIETLTFKIFNGYWCLWSYGIW